MSKKTPGRLGAGSEAVESLMAFSSSSVRDKYLSNPDHVDFSQSLIALAETISVIDFWTEKTE
jgi:Stress responsive A/B Barrel Domain